MTSPSPGIRYRPGTSAPGRVTGPWPAREARWDRRVVEPATVLRAGSCAFRRRGTCGIAAPRSWEAVMAGKSIPGRRVPTAAPLAARHGIKRSRCICIHCHDGERLLRVLEHPHCPDHGHGGEWRCVGPADDPKPGNGSTERQLTRLTARPGANRYTILARASTPAREMMRRCDHPDGPGQGHGRVAAVGGTSIRGSRQGSPTRLSCPASRGGGRSA